MILSKAFEHNVILYFLALGGALLTCFYMFRLFYLVFFGEQRLAGAHPHESPKVMTIPLIILGVLSVFGGFLNIPSLFGGNLSFSNFLQSAVSSKVSEEISSTTEIELIILSLVLLILVIGIAYRTYVRKANLPARDGEPMSIWSRIVVNKFYIDKTYMILVEKPYSSFSNFLFNKVETKVLNPIVDGIGEATSRIGILTRKLQRGNMSFYFFAMVAGILLFIVFILTI